MPIRSEHAANAGLARASAPNWQQPAPRRYAPPRRTWRDVRAALLGYLLTLASALLLAGAIVLPSALHWG